MPIPKDPIKAMLWKKRLSESQRGKSKNAGKDNPFYGHKHTKETRKFISESQRGEKNPLFGKKRPQYVIDAMIKGRKEKGSPFKGKTFEEIYGAEKAKKLKKDISRRVAGNKYRIGKNHTEETKKKISEITRQRTPRGKNHPRWKGGCGRYARYYSTVGYKAWRKDVFERDNYTCQKCNDKKGGNLNAHHIISFKECLETSNGLEFDINNGITLCEPCHKKLHSKAL